MSDDVVSRRVAINRLLRPRSVAIVGASPTLGSLGGGVLLNLERFGFKGDIHLVNPSRKEINGRPCVATTLDLPHGVDAVVLAIPQKGVLDALRGCAARGVGGVIVFSAGFVASYFIGFPIWGPNVLGNIFCVLCVLLLRQAFREYLRLDRPGDLRRLWMIEAACAAGLFAAHAFQLGTGVRFLFVLVPSGVALLDCARMLFQAKQESRVLRLLSAMWSATFAFICLARTAIGWLLPPSKETSFSTAPGAPSMLLPAFMFAAGAVILFGSVTLILLAGSRLKGELTDLAMRDGLTGLFNRRAFFELARAQLQRVGRLKSPYSVVMLDLDHFKAVNDTFGHQGGDEALRHAASLVHAALRESDIAARYGGEEFIILLGETEPEGALLVAERIRQSAEASLVKMPDGRGASVRFSLGVAGMTGVAAASQESGDESHRLEHLSNLIAQADAALYEAKRGGRNRTVVSGKDTTTTVSDRGERKDATDAPLSPNDSVTFELGLPANHA